MGVREVYIVGIIFVFYYSSEVSADQQCGRPLGSEFMLINERIVAGYDVGYYRYPWYVGLVRYGSINCGAALISSKHVLTAAHCYKEYQSLAKLGLIKLENVYEAKLGAYNICETEKTQKNFKIAKVEVHELYATKKPYYDICLLTLADDASSFTPICLPPSFVKVRPNDGTIPGFGTLKYKGATPCTLHEARILVYSDQDCYNMINSTGNNASEITKAFCAGYINGGVDACQGDSGGPFQVISSNGDYVLLGIVSFGFHCAMPGVLGMYTDVSQYLDWIRGKSGINITSNINKEKLSTTTILPTTISSNSTTSSSPHIEKPDKPYHRPIRVIIIHNKHLIMVRKNVMHKPIKRN